GALIVRGAMADSERVTASRDVTSSHAVRTERQDSTPWVRMVALPHGGVRVDLGDHRRGDQPLSEEGASGRAERMAGPGAHSSSRGPSPPEWRMTMRGIRHFSAPCGLGLAVLLNLPAGLAAAPAAAAVRAAEPLPWAAESYGAGAAQVVRPVAGREAA